MIIRSFITPYNGCSIFYLPPPPPSPPSLSLPLPLLPPFPSLSLPPLLSPPLTSLPLLPSPPSLTSLHHVYRCTHCPWWPPQRSALLPYTLDTHQLPS